MRKLHVGSLRNRLAYLLISIFALSLYACGGGGGGGGNDSPEPLVLGTLSTNTGNTSFRQTVAMQDSDTFEYFPGQPNNWEIGNAFQLDDGGDDQFDGALRLNVGGLNFPSSSYGELSFYTPEIGSANGIKVAAVVDGVERNYNNTAEPAIGGTYSALLNDIHDGRLSQTVDLSGATGTVGLTWDWVSNINSGIGMSPYLRAVVRNTVDNSILGAPLASVAITGNNSYSVDLSAFTGSSIIISFEISSSGNGPTLIDNVSLTDGAATQYITNGDFETGNLTGWNTNSPSELQNFTSPEKSLSGLTITRSFYTVPNKLWGRWVDVFQNETVGDITVTIRYDTNLGSDNYGILYLTPGAEGQALTGWDGDAQSPADPTSSDNDRDFAIIFGLVDSVDFTSDDVLGVGNGVGNISQTYNLTIPSGETKAIVNFIVMNGVDTGDTATDITAQATAIDNEVLKILDNFWIDGQYRTGMTQAQIDAIVNL